MEKGLLILVRTGTRCKRAIVSYPMSRSKFILSTVEDISEIFSIYENASKLQHEKGQQTWKGFERSLVIKEIEEGRLWKIIADHQMAGVFSLNFQKENIWAKHQQEFVFYIHRIAKRSGVKIKLLDEILPWAKEFASTKGLKYLRLDTFSNNKQLVGYYMLSGFHLKEVIKTDSDLNLPLHYQNSSLALLELEI